MKRPLETSAARGLAIILLGLLAPASPARAELYGITFFDNELIAINPTNGAGTLVGPLGANVSAYGLANRFNNLYTFDPNIDRIRQINPSTGAILATIDIGVGNLVGEGDLAFRSDGIGFLSSALNPTTSDQTNDLFRFDITTGTSTRIGTTAVTFDGLAFGPNDVLFGLGQLDGTLYRIDQGTGATTVVGLLGVTSGSPFAGLTFGPGGLLYAALDDRLYTVNPTTGMATPVHPDLDFIGFSSVSGIAFATVPEPTSALSIGLGLAGLLAVRLRKKA